MVGRLLRVNSLLVIALATVFTVWLINLGVQPVIAVAAGLTVPVAMHALPLGIEFLVGSLVDRRPTSRLGTVDAAAMWLTESWRSFAVFNIDQPWRSAFAERSIVADPGRPAVLLIHGYMCNRATWRSWVLEGLPRTWNVATVNLEPAFAPIDDYAVCIAEAVALLRAASGAERVTLVCHSMGGLAARAFLRAHGTDVVEKVITIDTPHHGTMFARFAQGANTKQMRRDCDYVRGLAKSEEPVEFICFASQHDNLIIPRDSQVLACAEAVWFEKIGHLAMTTHSEVLARLIQAVERPVASIAPAKISSAFDATGIAPAQG